MKTILVHIPAFNEEKTIAEVIADIPAQIAGYQTYIVVTDDGSSDKTAKIALGAGADTLLQHSYNKGIGCVFKTATDYFFRSDADIFVNIDADRQFDPAQIVDLVMPVINGQAEMVVGNRFDKKTANNMPKIKANLNQCIAKIVGHLMNYPIQDLTCGLRAYSKEALMRLSLVETFTYTQDTIIEAIEQNIKLIRVPIKVTYFSDRKSRVVKTIRGYMKKSISVIMRSIRDSRPLMFFGRPAVWLLALGAGSIVRFRVGYLNTGLTSAYRTWLLVGSSLLVMGVLLGIYAMIADMLKKHRKITQENVYLLREHLSTFNSHVTRGKKISWSSHPHSLHGYQTIVAPDSSMKVQKDMITSATMLSS